jgi:hypothetical protein
MSRSFREIDRRQAIEKMARKTGLEPATSAVTGQLFFSKINGLSYFLSQEITPKVG